MFWKKKNKIDYKIVLKEIKKSVEEGKKKIKDELKYRQELEKALVEWLDYFEIEKENGELLKKEDLKEMRTEELEEILTEILKTVENEL